MISVCVAVDVSPRLNIHHFMKLKLVICTILLTASFCFAQTNNPITRETVRSAEALIGLDFSDAKVDMLMPGLKNQLGKYEAMRRFPLSNSVPPAIQFNPLPVGFKFESEHRKFKPSPAPKMKLPANLDDLAFYSVGELAALIKSRQITSEKLTKVYLNRLKKYGPKLECVITLTEDLALEQARRADREIAAGKYRGPLHGIPYGAKDLFAVKNIPTTWGAGPYTNQVFDFDATVIKRLEDAGAVLVAKTSMGELAMGETWFGGMTRNPWNPKDGSSGSSAGSAAGVSAGLFAFAIGTETYGSIISPCDRCGDTGLRPTYGSVSRAGAMTLSWSMDKIGPICRTVEDCALIFNTIRGPDGIDQTVYDVPFNYNYKTTLKKLRIGYLKSDFEKETGERKKFDDATLKELHQLGANLVPVEFPQYPLSKISFLLSTEAASAFDELTLSGRDDLLKQQTADDWANSFREKRFVPAVEYLRAQRIRYLLIQDTARVFDNVDVIVAPTQTGSSVLLGNLTGNPSVVVPNGFSTNGTPTSICFIGKLFDEADTLEVAKCYQDATAFHLKHPSL